MLAEARRRLAAHPTVEFVRGDSRTFSLDRRFDLITCSGDSLNYAQDIGELAATFQCVARVLADGGVFAFDVQAPASRSRRHAIRVRSNGDCWYQVFDYDAATGVDEARAVTAAGVEVHRRRLFTPAEIAAAAMAAGSFASISSMAVCSGYCLAGGVVISTRSRPPRGNRGRRRNALLAQQGEYYCPRLKVTVAPSDRSASCCMSRAKCSSSSTETVRRLRCGRGGSFMTSGGDT
jgi:SAM-dependent methyltransferase